MSVVLCSACPRSKRNVAAKVCYCCEQAICLECTRVRVARFKTGAKSSMTMALSATDAEFVKLCKVCSEKIAIEITPIAISNDNGDCSIQ